MEGNPYWKAVYDCFNDGSNAFTIVDKIEIENPEEKLKIGSTINDNLVRLRGIRDQDYTVQYVPKGVDIDTAIDIFDRVNSQGTKLTDAELVLTHISGKWPHARRVMKQQIARYAEKSFYFELDFLTRCMVVLLTHSASYEKMTFEVYERTTKQQYEEAWAKLVKIFDYLVPILRSSAYLSGSKDLNTNNVYVPMVAYLSKHKSFTQSTKNNFIRWMFLAAVWGRYSGQTDQRLNRDVYIVLNNDQPIQGLLNEIEDQRGRLEIKPADLQGRGAGHPLHRMLYTLSRYSNATDWANGGSLTDTMGDYYSVQSHHIFPQSYLYKNGFSSESHLEKMKVNEVANRAFITRDTNYGISDKPPADYLPQVLADYPKALDEQHIPTEPTLWQIDKYEEFLVARRAMLADAINAFIDSFDSEEDSHEINHENVLAMGEDDYTEFKTSMRWDPVRKIVNKDLEHTIARTIAAFMNSGGGTLYIGVEDDGTVVGVENDYVTFKNKNRDGFLLYLTELIGRYIGKEFNQFTDFKIVEINGKDVCVVSISKAAMPAYVSRDNAEDFYVRSSASSQNMSVREASEYIKLHWD
jgi:hypothetical protein